MFQQLTTKLMLADYTVPFRSWNLAVIGAFSSSILPSLQFQIMTVNMDTDAAYMNTEIPISQTHQ